MPVKNNFTLFLYHIDFIGVMILQGGLTLPILSHNLGSIAIATGEKPTMGKDFQRTFGIEIEFLAPLGRSLANVAAAVSANGVPTQPIEWRVRHLHTDWAIKTDRSIGDTERGFEIVSPPLFGEGGFLQVEKVCHALARIGCTITKTCGLHVHIDARKPTVLDLATLRRLALLYIEHEALIDMCMPESRRGLTAANGFCRGIRNASVEAIMSCQSVDSLASVLRNGKDHHHHDEVPPRRPLARRVRQEMRSIVERQSWRYVKLNFMSIEKYGTVEFRHHGGTLDPLKIRNWVYACQRMVQYAERGGNAQVVREVRRIVKAVRKGTKHAIVCNMLMRPEGCTHAEVLAATGWRQVSVAWIGHVHGMELRQERRFNEREMTRELRYWGRIPDASQPTLPDVPRTHRTRADNFDEFFQRLGMDLDEIEFWQGRRELFAKASMAFSSASLVNGEQ